MEQTTPSSRAQTLPMRRPRWLQVYGLVTVALLAVGLYLALVVSPPDVQQGNLIRIMYAHVSVAWVCFLAVALSAFFGALYLWRGGSMNDIISVASAESALFFSALTLLGGMIYSRPTLNTWWAWDAKLTATALLFFMLVGYFIARGLIDNPERRGRVAAIIAIITLADVPIIYFASDWWRTLHPSKSIRLDGAPITMDPTMLQVLLFNVAVGALIYGYFMIERVRLGRLEAGLQQQHDQREESRDMLPEGQVVHV